jgi:hypothetical protein
MSQEGVRRAHAALITDDGVRRAACWAPNVDLDPARHAFSDDDNFYRGPNCPHCLRWLKGDKTPGCCAIVSTLEGAKHYSRQRIIIYNHKRCDRKAKVRVGQLSLCATHHRLMREGFVDEHGNVTNHSDIAGVRNHREKFPHGFHSWHRDLPNEDV